MEKTKETSIFIKLKNGNALLRNSACMSMIVMDGFLTLRDGINGPDTILIEEIEEVKVI